MEEMQSLLEEEVESQFKKDNKSKQQKKKRKKSKKSLTTPNITTTASTFLPSFLSSTSGPPPPTYDLPPLVLNPLHPKTALRPYTKNYGQIAPTYVTEDQIATFRNLLAQHHQLLLQTCAVAVRRAVGSESNGGLGGDNKAIVLGPGGETRTDKEAIKGECLNVVESR